MASAPPTGRWHTREDSGIRLDRELRWWHDGVLVEHPKIVEVFNIGLRPRDDGKFELRIGQDWCLVEVEEAAYEVRGVEAHEGRVQLLLSDRTREQLQPETLRSGADNVLTCRVKNDRATARFNRAAQFALGEMLDQRPDGWALKVGESIVPLPQLRPQNH